MTQQMKAVLCMSYNQLVLLNWIPRWSARAMSKYQENSKIWRSLNWMSKTPSALPSVDAAVINNTLFVKQALICKLSMLKRQQLKTMGTTWSLLRKDWEKNLIKQKQSKKSSKAYPVKTMWRKWSKNLQEEWTNQSSKIWSQVLWEGGGEAILYLLSCIRRMHAFCNRSGTNP